MTKKEDYITALKHGIPESIPYYGKPVRHNIGFMDTFEKGPIGGGYDGYGVRWEFADNSSCPATDKFTLTDITKWEEQVTFPDLDAIDWKAKAEKELAGYDPETQIIDYAMGNGPFERLLAWMGYQYLIDAILDEPEACEALLNKWVEHRLHFIELVAKYYKPDCITIYDDVAFERGLFLTRDMYEDLIQPATKTVVDAIKATGAFAINHCCGKAEELVENFIDEGYDAWTSAQPMNDLAGVLEKYHDKLTVIGGYDSNGAPSREDATEEDRIAEVHRTIDDYSRWGSFILGNMIFMANTQEARMAKIQPCAEEVFRYGYKYYERHGIK